MDKEEVTLNIDDGKRVDLENHKIMVAIPIGGKRERGYCIWARYISRL